MERGFSFGTLTSITLRHLERNQADVDASLRKLASGLRIERAADDPAGLAVSERLRARVASQRVAARNIQDGVSLLRTAEGSLAEVSGLLGRMRALSLAALNGTASSADLDALTAEYSELAREVERQVRAARYDGLELLRADRTLGLQVGADPTDRVDLELYDLSAMGTVLQLLDLRVQADAALQVVDGYVDLVADVRARFGAQEGRLGSALRSLAVSTERLAEADSRMRDLDVAREVADLTGAEIRRDAAIVLASRAQFEPLVVLTLLQGPLAVAPRAPARDEDEAA